MAVEADHGIAVKRVERRQRYRVPTEIEVTWTVREDHRPVLATIVDLSAAGARLVAAECPPLAGTVVIRLQTSYPPMDLHCPARVVRVADVSSPEHYIWAVVFDDLNLDHQARIARFVFLEASRTRSSRPAFEPGYAQTGERAS
jgi:c-di-GMP-binding flagellar brake protein YcgR